MNKYWRIGTGAMTYVSRFEHFVTENNLMIKDSFLLIENDNLFIAQLKNGENLEIWNSDSTAYQYLTAWEALGFISKRNNLYYISTNFRDLRKLILFSMMNIITPSIDEKVDKYRKTIIINILVAGSLLNQYDIQKKQIFKGTTILNISVVKDSISKYEKEIIKSKEMLKMIKEYYDTKF